MLARAVAAAETDTEAGKRKDDLMLEKGHVAGGYLVTWQVLKRWSSQGRVIPESERKKLLLLGTAAGTLPDVDVLLYALKTRSLEFGRDFDHHRWVTHTFPFYIIPGLLVYLYARSRQRPSLARLAVVMTTGAATHVLQDAVGSGTGIMWAWPFSQRMDGIIVLHTTGKAWRQAYQRHPVAWIERLLVATAVVTCLVDLVRGHSDHG